MSQSPEKRPVRPIGEDDRAPSESELAERPGIEQLRAIIGESIDVLRRRRRSFGSIFGVVAALLVLIVLIQTPIYESTALMLVKVGRELVYKADIGADASSFSTRDKDAVINSELAILRSQPVVEGVVRSISVDQLYPSLAEALEDAKAARPEGEEESAAEAVLYARGAEMLRGNLTAQALPDADVLQVSFRHEDPLIAAQTLNLLLERFLDAHLQAFAEPEIVAFLDGRVKEYEARLAESERALREFETAHSAFAAEQPQAVLLDQRSQLRVQIDTLDSEMAAIRLRHLQEDASVAEARRTLLALEVEASQLKGTARREVQDRIRVVEDFIATRKAEIDGELAALEQRREELSTELGEVTQELAMLPTLSAEYRSLVRARDADEEQHGTYLRRLRDARLSGEMDRERIASINVIQRGTPAPEPVWPPGKAMGSGVAMLLALVMAGLAVALLERMGPTGIEFFDQELKEAAGS